MRLKRWLKVFGSVVVAIILQGCAGTPTVLSASDRQSLRSLPLFARDGTPQFSLEAACNGEFGACNTIQHALARWADDRHIQMRMVDSVDSASPADRGAAAPYRLALSITPLALASYNKIAVNGQDLSGGYTSPKVSYRASLYVFDSTTGKQLRNISFHDERVTDFKADGNAYLRAELNTFIAGVDPSYRSR